MVDQTLETTVFGQEISFAYSDAWIGYSLFSLRLVMGWVFLQAGLTKLLEPGWTAEGYLANAVPEGNPFGDLWLSLAGIPFIDFLNIWGAILIGIALILGAVVRLSAFSGALMMLFYWASHLEGGLPLGLPVDHGYIVSSHIVYVLLLFGLGAFGAGRILGMDNRFEETNIVENNPWLRYVLG